MALINWKHSKLRFYWKNLLWNYSFWLNAKPTYGIKKYKVPVDVIDEGIDFYYDTNYQHKFETKETKRFLGYMYKDKLYMDNPGIQGEDKETWDAWIKKGLIKNALYPKD